MSTEARFIHLQPGAVMPVDHSVDARMGLPPTPRSRFLEPFRQSVFSIGLLMLLLSGGVFLGYDQLSDPRRESANNNMLFMVHYGLAVSFSVLLIVNGLLKFRQQQYADGRPARWLGLLLWLISAYALNREMAVFQQSTAWLCGALVAVGLAMGLYGWKESLSVRAQQGLYAVLAFGWWLFAYMAVYVSQLYPVSIPLLIALGLSAHTFVPLVFAVSLGKRLWQDAQREEHLRLGIGVGLTIPVLAVCLFLTGWISDLNLIEQTRQEATIRKTSDLPDWVLIGQQLNANKSGLGRTAHGWITNRLLLSNRVYDRGRFFDSGDWGLTGLTALDDVRQHDPLVVIASRLFPADVLADADQLSLLKVLSADRHGTQEKFWTGRHLTTQDVVSQVRIWPQFRLSYTEQTVRIRNQSRNTTEEALLTYHLPPGSVVSAMSLWVNGKEEPARLTTVAKADSAYRTIVNVESRNFARDPSVVYWQEGNRVAIRVFPCRAGDDRRVKIGITSPLKLTDNQLVYQNPYFDGPSTESARELVRIDFASTPSGIKTPWLFDGLSGKSITHKGGYDPNWQLTFQAPALSADAFVLNDRTYRTEAYTAINEPFTPTDVYLDVNASWQKYQFTTAFWTVAKRRNCRVWVFDDGMKQLTASTLDATYERLSQQTFSLFPVYRITNPATALLITKGTSISPILSDLRGSAFADHFGMLATQTAVIRTFCYESASGVGELPSYLKTLSELRILNAIHGTTCDLINLLEKANQFPRQPDTETRTVLPEAGIAIQESPASTGRASVAPDHLARLFAYNHLLQQVGRHYFAKNYQTDALIQEAQRAHVVSPLSSLVVLETAKDYKRFGIKKDMSGLDNATLKQEGAVPEPHEWALLSIAAGLIGWLIWKKRYAVA